LTTSKAPEQVAPEQSLLGTAGATTSTTSEASEQVAPEQSLSGTPVEKHVPKTNQSVPEQITAPMWSTQGGLPNVAARGKSVATSSLAGLHRERKQTSAEQAAEFDDDVIKEIQGHPQDGRQHIYVYRECGDHYVCHKEISIDKETKRVEWATRWLIGEVQVGVLHKYYYRSGQIYILAYMALYLACRAS
jgi:hypothetical protein